VIVGKRCFVGSTPRLYNEEFRPAEVMNERELRVGSQLSSAREAEKRWRYS
jgi:hypothetical protein